jgi:8-oxo-dGTP diphosphatase
VRDATLCYPIDGDRVLLMRKKRGVGSGLYNGPGGKVEGDETPREAAVREVREEVRLDVSSLRKVGELDFTFGDDPFHYVHVFRTEDFVGTPAETPEADPAWFRFDDVPYEHMWEDDRYWLPLVFEGTTFHGEFRFDADGDELLEWTLDVDVSI